MRTVALPAPTLDGDGRPICEVCRKPIRPDEAGAWALVVGYVQSRPGGGAGGVSERRDLGVYRHNGCHRYGGQGSLL